MGDRLIYFVYLRVLLASLLTLLFSTPVLSDGVCPQNASIEGVTQLSLKVAHYETANKNACLVGGKEAGLPSVTNNKAIKFSVWPGYCSSDATWSDCETDRARSELYDAEIVRAGKRVTYSFQLYIPSATDLFQNGRKNRLFFAQLNAVDQQHYSSPVMLEWRYSEGLQFVIYDDFNWDISRRINIGETLSQQKDRWLKFKFVIDVSAQPEGQIQLFYNDTLRYQANRPVIPSAEGGVKLRFGLYSTKVSSMRPPRSTQTVFFDVISKQVE